MKECNFCQLPLCPWAQINPLKHIQTSRASGASRTVIPWKENIGSAQQGWKKQVHVFQKLVIFKLVKVNRDLPLVIKSRVTTRISCIPFFVVFNRLFPFNELGCVPLSSGFCLIFYLFTFREMGREREREGEKHQCVRDINLLPLTRPQPESWPATQACALSGNPT